MCKCGPITFVFGDDMLSEVWNLIGTSQVTAIIGLLTLATTVYFTRTLVNNDNNRERRADLEKQERKNQQIIEWCINDWKRCGSSPGLLQATGNNLVRRFGPDKVNIILDSYELFANQNHESKMYGRREFLNMMRGYSEKNREIWPEE